MSLGGVIGGLIGSGQKLPTVDISGLLATIKAAGTNQRALINGLPANVQALLGQYAASDDAAGNDYKAGITGAGNDLLTKTAGLYGPDSAAANAEKAADKTAIYSTVPGTSDAVRNAMAATGGLGRGNAGVALVQPYMQAAQQYGQAAAGVNAAQAKAGQDATQKALSTVASMNDAMFLNLFGMSKQQAQTILTTGNQALTTQLADLINQSNMETNQTLGAEGIAANNGYQNAVTRNAQQGAIWNGLADLGVQGATAAFGGGGMPGFMTGMGGGLPAGADVGSADYMTNAANMAPKVAGAF